MPLALLSYWREALIAVLVAGCLWYRAEAATLRASAAIEAAKTQEQLKAARDADAAYRQQLEQQTAAITQAIQEQANVTQVAIAKAKSVAACAHTPAADAFDRSMRQGHR